MAHILVVDDDPLFCRMTAFRLAKAGHAVIQAQDGREAMGLLRHFQETSPPVELVITDLHLPEMDGLELIRAIRAEAWPVRILAVSAGGKLITLDFLPTARIFGADNVLKKPFSASNLTAAVTWTLGRRLSPSVVA